MSVRKRTWRTAAGETKEAWLVDYSDQNGKRHAKTFDRKKEADAYHSKVNVEVDQGLHTPDGDSITVAQASELWLTSCANLERATRELYDGYARLHICKHLGTTKLSRLTTPAIRSFEDKLRAEEKSPPLIRKIMVALSGLLSDAQDRGLITRNVVRERGRRRKDRTASRQQHKVTVGVDIPTRDEIRAIVASLQGPWRAFLLTAIFTGLRASELRGLRWSDVDLAKGELHVRQRADKFNEIGSPKSAAGSRTVPLQQIVVSALRELYMQRREGIVFTALRHEGEILALSTVIACGWKPAQVAAGVTGPDGKAKYTGLHVLRHFYASWCINSIADGGLGLPLKTVQARLGHSTLAMTADTYGHLFPQVDEAAAGEAAVRSLLG